MGYRKQIFPLLTLTVKHLLLGHQYYYRKRCCLCFPRVFLSILCAGDTYKILTGLRGFFVLIRSLLQNFGLTSHCFFNFYGMWYPIFLVGFKFRYSLSPGVWQSFVTIRSCNHLMRIISTYVDNTKKSEIS